VLRDGRIVRPAGLCVVTSISLSLPLCRIGSFVPCCLFRCVYVPSVLLPGMGSGRVNSVGEQLNNTGILDLRFLL
jgi:hypothetical protein